MTEAKSDKVDRNVEDDIVQKSDFELCNSILYHTSLPRLAIFKILWGIGNNKILLSNQDILAAVTRKIKDRLTAAKAKAIYKYDVVEGYEFEEGVIFAADVINEEHLQGEKLVYATNSDKRKAVNKFYRTDSVGEYDFAESLDFDINENILLYTKIKKGGFVIDTPYGNYSPDWAIVYKATDGKVRLYFIVETKFKKDWKGLSDEEQDKIEHCGRLHFEEIDRLFVDDVFFDWANSFEDFRDKAEGECSERVSVN